MNRSCLGLKHASSTRPPQRWFATLWEGVWVAEFLNPARIQHSVPESAACASSTTQYYSLLAPVFGFITLHSAASKGRSWGALLTSAVQTQRSATSVEDISQPHIASCSGENPSTSLYQTG